jgi:hypothetical protein
MHAILLKYSTYKYKEHARTGVIAQLFDISSNISRLEMRLTMMKKAK